MSCNKYIFAHGDDGKTRRHKMWRTDCGRVAFINKHDLNVGAFGELLQQCSLTWRSYLPAALHLWPQRWGWLTSASLQGDKEQEAEMEKRRNWVSCMYLYDSDHRIGARVLFSLLLKGKKKKIIMWKEVSCVWGPTWVLDWRADVK